VKKNIVVAFGLICLQSSIFCLTERDGRSFMFTRPASASIVLRENARRTIEHQAPTSTCGSGLYAATYGETSHNYLSVDRYFLLNAKNCLLVAGDMAAQNLVQQRDIRAEWLGLPDNFSGIMSMEPKQEQYGFFIGLHQELCHITNFALLKNSYIDIILPVTYVRNNAHLTQSDVVNPGSQVPRDIIEAFNQPAWQYAKIDGPRHRQLTSDLRMECGTTYLNSNFFEMRYYAALTLPTSNTQNAHHFFDPTTGYNGHAGAGGGMILNLPLTECYHKSIQSIFIYLESIFLFHRKQKRTFDLKGKPYSRFMLYNLKNGAPDQLIPGVNLLTLEVNSRPYGIVDFCLGYRVTFPHTELEVGYGIWGHAEERVKFAKRYAQPAPPTYPLTNPVDPRNAVSLYPLGFITPFPNEFGIAGVGNGPMPPAPGVPGPATSHLSSINHLAINDTRFIEIGPYDIDLSSGEAASAFLQRFHCALTILNASTNSVSGSLGFGVYAELKHQNKNRPLAMYGGWFSLGIAV